MEETQSPGRQDESLKQEMDEATPAPLTETFGTVAPVIFKRLQDKIDEDAAVREEIRSILQFLERQSRNTLSILSRAHSATNSQLEESIFLESSKAIADERDIIRNLSKVGSKHPYYKYNSMWTRDIQNTCFCVLFHSWLGGYDGQKGRLLTIEEVGNLIQVPVNLKTEDAFHFTIEEYLHALISLIEELARLAVNSVTLGDYARPLMISQFIKDIHAGFQLLNLKNDSLRKRSDSIKYSLKKVEDVVYDLSLRNLIPKPGVSG